MGLEKAIQFGKEHRKQFRNSKQFDYSCRNHGSCNYCENNRTHFDKKHRTRAELDLKDYVKSFHTEN